MKALPLILASSLIANAALVTVTVRHSVASADSAKTSASASSTSGSSASKSRPLTKDGKALIDPELIDALNANNLESLRDLLRSAGLSEDMVRTIVQMRVWKNYEARFKALQPQPDPNRPWWKDDRNQQNSWGGMNMTRAQREESRRINQEVRAEMERLLGADANKNMFGGWQDNRLSFLPAEKRQALQQIQQDYQELMGEIHQDSQGFRLASDAEKLRFLQEEQKRDIEAMMTPEERKAYELRMSSTAQQLRNKMTQYDATEQEYLAIFPLQKAFDEKYNQNDPYGYSGGERDQNYWKERSAAEKQLQDQIKATLGEQRYAESIKLQDNDYRQLEAATRRLELPADTPERVFALRDNAASTAQQIADNPSLGTDQKKQALAALATATREQVRTSLGQEGADAYFKNNGMGWLKELDRGNTIVFNKDSNGWSTKSLPKEPKKPATK